MSTTAALPLPGTSERDDPLMRARRDLSAFIRDQALETKKAVGFGWVGVPAAPDTYQQLRGAWHHSKVTGAPLPVSKLFCDSVIYLEPSDNLAFRFWHDVHHVQLGLSFALPDELELALWHLDQLEEAGHPRGTLTHRLLEADLVGQVLIMAVGGRFPFDQMTFVQACADEGLTTGVLAELRRISSANPGSSQMRV